MSATDEATTNISTESQARAEGMTREVIGRSFHQELNLLIAPESDLDELFIAYDLDAGEIITVRGWLGVFEDADSCST